MKSSKKIAFLFLFISLILILIGVDFNITGNFINNYFVGRFSILHFIGLFLFVSSLIVLVSKKLEAIVVPTGPSYEADRQRAEGGLRKYHEDNSRLVIISGEVNEKNGERKFIGSQPMKIYKQMRKQGVPRDHFIFESHSHNTQENVRYICEEMDKIKDKKDITNIIIVTDEHHAKRFKMLFNKSKKYGLAPKSLKIETYSRNIERTYNPFKATLAYIKDYFTFGKSLR
jgi:uncharacterized SAM-binding protein YcdF (DUF218 family)